MQPFYYAFLATTYNFSIGKPQREEEELKPLSGIVPKKLSCPSSSSSSVSFAKSPSFSFVTTTTPPTSSSFFCVSPSVFAFHFDIDILPDGPPFRPFPCFSWYPQMNFSPFPSFPAPQAVLSHDPNSAAHKKKLRGKTWWVEEERKEGRRGPLPLGCLYLAFFLFHSTTLFPSGTNTHASLIAQPGLAISHLSARAR